MILALFICIGAVLLSKDAYDMLNAGPIDYQAILSTLLRMVAAAFLWVAFALAFF